MKRILVPTDFSECAGAATHAAMLLAQKTGAEIHFLHLLSVPADWIHLVDYAAKMYADVQAKVRKTSRALEELVQRAERAGLQAKHFICYSESHTKILQHIDRHDIDFVIMGSYGASGFKELFMGSLSHKIARLSPVPVLVVKSPLQIEQFTNVVFTSDFEDDSLPQYKEVVAFCREIGAALHLVYINSPIYFLDTDTINRKVAAFSALNPDLIASVTTYNYQSLEGGLLRFSELLNPDMIVLIIHSRKPLFNNLVDYALNFSGKPVLCISKEVVKARQRQARRGQDTEKVAF
jgi:nucleotide-binding universal stress UspA family protein